MTVLVPGLQCDLKNSPVGARFKTAFVTIASSSVDNLEKIKLVCNIYASRTAYELGHQKVGTFSTSLPLASEGDQVSAAFSHLQSLTLDENVTNLANRLKVDLTDSLYIAPDAVSTPEAGDPQ